MFDSPLVTVPIVFCISPNKFGFMLFLSGLYVGLGLQTNNIYLFIALFLHLSPVCGYSLFNIYIGVEMVSIYHVTTL